MSTAAVSVGAPLTPGRRPGYWTLFGRTFVAQIGAGACLLAIGMVLSGVSLVGLSGSSLRIFSPWIVDGAWPLLAALGWGLLVVALVGAFVRGRLGAQPPSRVLTMLSVAVAGYIPWLLSMTDAGRAGLSVLLLPAILRVAAYDDRGRPRVLPQRLEPPTRVLLAASALAAVALIALYALLHPFAVRGSGDDGASSMTASGRVFTVRPGRLVQHQVGLQGAEFPITVTKVQLLGNLAPLRVVAITPGSGMPVQQWIRTAPGGPTPPARAPARFPVRVGARHSLWVGWAVTLRSCSVPPGSVTRLRITYRELGLTLSQTVALGADSTLLRCW